MMALGGLMILFIVVVLLGVLLLVFGFMRMMKYHAIEDTPTSKIRSVAVGLSEINGSVVAKEKLTTPCSKKPCVYYKYDVEEYRQHTSTDGKGNTHISYRWDNILSDERYVEFTLKDESGGMGIIPKGAEFALETREMFFEDRKTSLKEVFSSIREAFSQKSGIISKESVLTPIKKNTSISPSVGDRRHYEKYIASGDVLYVIGTASIDKKDAGKLVICKGERGRIFVISDKDEKETARSFRSRYLLQIICGIVLTAAGTVLIIVM